VFASSLGVVHLLQVISGCTHGDGKSTDLEKVLKLTIQDVLPTVAQKTAPMFAHFGKIGMV
jgi:hypothetical protein